MNDRILIDARKLGDTGIGVYLENLVDGLLELREAGEDVGPISLLVNPDYLNPKIRPMFDCAVESVRRWGEQLRLIPEPAKKYSLAEQFILPFRQRSVLREHDVFHSPHYTLPRFLGIPAVVTLHDVIHLTHPDTRLHKPVAKLLIKSALRRATEVITVSEASRARINEHFPKLNSPLTVIPNALQRGFEPPDNRAVAESLSRRKLSRPFCLFIGGERPHKGLRTLLEAWALARERFDAERMEIPNLALVGERYSQTTVNRISQLGLEDKVRFLGRVPQRELTLLFYGSDAVVVPSREEGFGLVPLQAMGCGRPVLATPIPSVREVCADAAWYSKDLSGEAIANTLLELFRAPEARAQKIALGLKRAAEFTRVRAAKETLAVYRRAAQSRKAGSRKSRSSEQEIQKQEQFVNQQSGS